MKSTCAILLDTSASMAGGFAGEPSGSADFGGYGSAPTVVVTRTKIADAQKWLLEELRELPNTEVVLISFDVSARIVVSASTRDLALLRDCAQTLEAHGSRTNLASGLYLAMDAVGNSPAYIKTALLISDGLSNEGDPILAADACRNRGIQVNTILIDSTTETEVLAGEISKGGAVLPVTSESEFAGAIKHASLPHEAILRRHPNG